MVASSLASSYAWVVHLPLDYVRMGTYLAIPLVVAIRAAWARSLRGGSVLAVVPVLFVANEARDLGTNLRAFYQIADTVTLRGLAALDERTKGSSPPIVTDQCWGVSRTLASPAPDARGPRGLDDPVPARSQSSSPCSSNPVRRRSRSRSCEPPGHPLCRAGSKVLELVGRKVARVTIRGTPLFASTGQALVLELPDKRRSGTAGELGDGLVRAPEGIDEQVFRVAGSARTAR